ncbi:hypothetical protein [Ktedonospora formicarum]|uniref:Uncharacterized protein n=1 Tax=Ktedonospora formicarum TaxID=2778364 RepID=A0A8J3HYC8_9CHLR|nr:hypothetical protein [Ktedonospora formicarum]GHO43380.1 hypothetical protein KSX_15430 [Ktedonospora formicarum]
MNASTSGPHILLFERDQQLAGLLIGELQLAGYDCHTARTAVEVFDAIARLPIRLILVNLSQAAAARREFWVALDTQRRGRGIQVLTFNCTNIAGYGPRDFDDHISSTPADVEVDGMLGVMGLVDAVRARVPSQQPDASGSTAPRMSTRMSPANSGMAAQSMPRPSQPMPSPLSGMGSQPTYRSHSSPEQMLSPQRSNMPSYTNQVNPTPNPHPAPYQQTPPPISTQGMPHPSPLPDELSQPSYTDKIHAVLYPNQRAWTPQNNPSLAGTPENKYEAQSAILSSFSEPVAPTPPPSGSNLNTLQRLASGQLDGGSESGLAQLSRLIQGRQTPAAEPAPTPFTPEASPFRSPQSFMRPSPIQDPPATPHYPAQQPPRVETPPASLPYQTPQPGESNPLMRTYATHSAPVAPEQNAPMRPFQPTGEQHAVNPPLQSSGEHFPYAPSERGGQKTPASPPLTPSNEQIITQPMRPAPIQDMPAERNTSGTTSTENTARRPDVLSRANYGQPTGIPPLASIAAANTTPPPYTTAPHIPAVSRPAPEPREEFVDAQPEVIPDISAYKQEQQATQERGPQATAPTEPLARDKSHQEQVSSQDDIVEQIKAEMRRATEGQGEKEAPSSSNASVLIDIMQSLPPMPAPTAQPPQAQILNGRATRSLGSVLLEGHLVPENRLDVAHNIQRMLRGVDLNYQLGEILLMFKLLTPDQLLAASLVSYGMINTTQIGSLGRIRQELHAMGLEYDLENLLIMFRVLTPEQLREAKADW